MIFFTIVDYIKKNGRFPLFWEMSVREQL